MPPETNSRALGGATTLVTGATGFIGSHLCRRLLAAGAGVYALSRSPQDNTSGILWRKADVADADSVRRVIAEARPDYVFHLASLVSGARDLALVEPTFSANLLSTVNVLTGAAEIGCKRMVLTGSLEEPLGEIEPIPCSPYAAAKFAATAYARMFHALYGLPVAMLRLFMVYGPAQKDLRKLIPYVTLSLLREERPKISSGTRLVDWIYVEDVVESILQAATADGAVGKVIDIGSGELVSIREIVEKLSAIVNPKLAPAFGGIPDRPMEQVRRANAALSREILGWKASISLDKGLRRTVEWYRAHLKELS